MMNACEIILYQNHEGNIKIDVRLKQETVWLTQEQMAILFGKVKSTSSEHTKNVLEEGELEQAATVREFPNSSLRRHKRSGERPRALQSRCSYFCRLPGKVLAGHPVSYMGYAAP